MCVRFGTTVRARNFHFKKTYFHILQLGEAIVSRTYPDPVKGTIVPPLPDCGSPG